MHELAIADSIVRTVTEEAEKGGFVRVTAVGVRIGALSAVVPEALQFGFEVIVKGTPLADTALHIEYLPTRARCNTCRKELEITESVFICPSCGSGDVSLTQGQELDIIYLDVE